MQKIISFFSAMVLVIAILAGTASAADVTSVRVDFSDGSYAVVTTISHGMTRASVNDSKVYTYYDENGFPDDLPRNEVIYHFDTEDDQQ